MASQLPCFGRMYRLSSLLSFAALLFLNLLLSAAAAPVDRLFLTREAGIAAAARGKVAGGAGGAEGAGARGGSELWFEQTLDHFNPADARTFPQRYYEDLSHFTAAAGGPVILAICGEAPCNGLPNDYRTELAAHNGAAVVALEHRFYGQSQPFADLSTANLAFLSANQALADLATFRQFYQQQLDQLFNATRNSSSSGGSSSERRWVVTGVSYAGALSAWARLSYPHLFHASLASSAVVNVIHDFYEFEEQVIVSAGPQCASILRNITHRIDLLLASSPADRESVKKLFASESVEDDGDFLFLLADAAVFAFQYGRPDDLCNPLVEAHANGSDTMLAYASYVRDSFFVYLGARPSDYDRHSITNTSLAGQSAGARAWLYQCCTQMAYFQTPARIGQPIRSAALNMSYWHDLCASVFGSHPRPLLPDTTATNTFFGGTSIASSRIFFTNGSQDPWKRASRLATSRAMPSVMVTCHNCGHGVDMRGCPTRLNSHPSYGDYLPSSCSDPAALLAVRGQIKEALTCWLQDDQLSLGDDLTLLPPTPAATAAM